MPVSGRLVSLAVQSMLATTTTRSCGYGTAPISTSTPTGATVPYSVLYPLGVTTSGPPYGDGDADARVLFQVTSVASTAEQVEWMADKVRTALLGRTTGGDFATAITVAGCLVIGRELDKEEGISVSGGVYSYVQRYVVTVTTLGS
ncbi:hypothetical protein [Streptomyces sp. NBC_01262]|uniref:hypothetical protein n=1 Tax=Streptomyces sp. NBC_01262 TaxID=2903803 RepID=UPI002E371596|nr:hypothetical protein [Streptomyces sp. NBC_01262]